MAGLAAMFVPPALAILDEMLAYLALSHYGMFLMETINSPWGQIRLPGSLERRAWTVSASPSYLQTWVSTTQWSTGRE